jgi:hypothetical protein
MAKKSVSIILRDVPEDVHERIVDEKARIEKATGKAGSNPQAIFNLIRRSHPK